KKKQPKRKPRNFKPKKKISGMKILTALGLGGMVLGGVGDGILAEGYEQVKETATEISESVTRTVSSLVNLQPNETDEAENNFYPEIQIEANNYNVNAVGDDFFVDPNEQDPTGTGSEETGPADEEHSDELDEFLNGGEVEEVQDEEGVIPPYEGSPEDPTDPSVGDDIDNDLPPQDTVVPGDDSGDNGGDDVDEVVEEEKPQKKRYPSKDIFRLKIPGMEYEMKGDFWSAGAFGEMYKKKNYDTNEIEQGVRGVGKFSLFLPIKKFDMTMGGSYFLGTDGTNRKLVWASKRFEVGDEPLKLTVGYSQENDEWESPYLALAGKFDVLGKDRIVQVSYNGVGAGLKVDKYFFKPKSHTIGRSNIGFDYKDMTLEVNLASAIVYGYLKSINQNMLNVEHHKNINNAEHVEKSLEILLSDFVRNQMDPYLFNMFDFKNGRGDKKAMKHNTTQLIEQTNWIMSSVDNFMRYVTECDIDGRTYQLNYRNNFFDNNRGNVSWEKACTDTAVAQSAAFLFFQVEDEIIQKKVSPDLLALVKEGKKDANGNVVLPAIVDREDVLKKIKFRDINYNDLIMALDGARDELKDNKVRNELRLEIDPYVTFGGDDLTSKLIKEINRVTENKDDFVKYLVGDIDGLGVANPKDKNRAEVFADSMVHLYFERNNKELREDIDKLFVQSQDYLKQIAFKKFPVKQYNYADVMNALKSARANLETYTTESSTDGVKKRTIQDLMSSFERKDGRIVYVPKIDENLSE
ncbi:hypothetical protein ACFL1H_08180, partial [Nanoarchaeota archaeon]